MNFISKLLKLNKNDNKDFINPDYTFYSRKQLNNLITNKVLSLYDVGYDSRKILYSNEYNFFHTIKWNLVEVEDFLEKLGLSTFNYKGYLLKNRQELISQLKKTVYYNNFQDKHFKLTKNGFHVDVEEYTPEKNLVFKSKKEELLKHQYDKLEREINQVCNEFNLSIKNEVICSKLRNYHSYTNIKPNIIINEHIDWIQKVIIYGIDEFKEFYSAYLLHVLNSAKKEYEGEMYGRLGEERVIETTNEFDKCIALHNIKLPAENSNGEKFTFEIDTVLVTTRGIFILEVKNYGSVGDYELKIDSTGRWSTYYPKTNTEITRENPNKQNNMHVINFNKFINQNLPEFDNNIDSMGVIVIGNNDVKITQENPSKNLKRIDELYNYIKEFPNNIYSMEEIRKISKCIKDNNIESDSMYPINYNYEDILNNIDFIKDDLKFLNSISNLSEIKNRSEEEVISYLIEQEKFYNYKFISPQVVKFILHYTAYDSYSRSYTAKEKNIMNIYPLDILD